LFYFEAVDAMIKAPNRDEIVEKLTLLINDIYQRSEVSYWVGQWVASTESYDVPDDIWNSLLFLHAADMIDIDGSFLYHEIDFQDELNNYLCS
jgi:hypothetical protein